MFLRHLERCLMLLYSGHVLLIFSNASLHLFQWAACCRTISWDRSPRKLCRTCEVFSPCKYSCNYKLRVSVWEGTLRCPVDHFVSSTNWWLVWAWGPSPQLLRFKSWRVTDRSCNEKFPMCVSGSNIYLHNREGLLYIPINICASKFKSEMMLSFSPRKLDSTIWYFGILNLFYL